MSSIGNRILDFWDWFSENEKIIKRLFINEDDKLISKISEKVKSINSGFVWEVGPGIKKEQSFVISPNRNKERLILSKEAIQFAPSLEGWEFFSAKPKKQWKRRLETNFEGKRRLVDFNGWSYFLTAFEGRRFFDITLVPSSFWIEEIGNLKELAGLLVENELGEELLIERIDRIEIENDEVESSRLTMIEHLYDHIRSLMT